MYHQFIDLIYTIKNRNLTHKALNLKCSISKTAVYTCGSYQWRPTLHSTNTIYVHLFEGVLHNNSQILENVPESKEGEADKETKGAADVRDQRDDVIGNHLVDGDFRFTP